MVATLDDLVDDNALPNQLEPWLGFGGLAQRLDQPALVERIVKQVVARFRAIRGSPCCACSCCAKAAGWTRRGRFWPALNTRRALHRNCARRWPPNTRLGDPLQAAEVLSRGPQNDSSFLQRAMLLDKAKDKAGLAALYDELKREATHPNPMRRMLLGQVAELLERNEGSAGLVRHQFDEDAQGIARLRSANVLFQLQRKQQARRRYARSSPDAMLDEQYQRDAYLLEAELRLKDKDAPGELDAYARGLAAFADDEALLYSRALAVGAPRRYRQGRGRFPPHPGDRAGRRECLECAVTPWPTAPPAIRKH